ncbi:MAG TPA: hypothetical protein VNF47_07390 [Streptosporangiaceae bacterium]|nr:hypothetical protein [Streptosporangiaceae bacterium]
MRWPQESAITRRDDQLARTRRLTIWIAGGATAASLGLAAALGYALPGHAVTTGGPAPAGQTSTNTGTSGGTGSGSGSGSGQSGSGTSGGGIAPPQQAPTTTTAPPVVSSGGS